MKPDASQYFLRQRRGCMTHRIRGVAQLDELVADLIVDRGLAIGLRDVDVRSVFDRNLLVNLALFIEHLDAVDVEDALTVMDVIHLELVELVPKDSVLIPKEGGLTLNRRFIPRNAITLFERFVQAIELGDGGGPPCVGGDFIGVKIHLLHFEFNAVIKGCRRPRFVLLLESSRRIEKLVRSFELLPHRPHREVQASDLWGDSPIVTVLPQLV